MATAPTGVVPPVVAMTSTEQTVGSAQEAPTTGVEQLGMGAMLPMEMARPMPGVARLSVTTMPQMEVEAPAMDAERSGIATTS